MSNLEKKLKQPKNVLSLFVIVPFFEGKNQLEIQKKREIKVARKGRHK